MNDEPEGLSGVRLLRARPWGIALAVLLTSAAALAYTWAWLSLIPGFGPMPSFDPGEALTRWVVVPIVAEIPEMVALISIAVLSRRRVTVGRALLLWILAALVSTVKNMLDAGLEFAVGEVGFDPLLVVAIAGDLVVLIGVGLLARWLLPVPGFPAVRPGRDLTALIVASFLMMALIEVFSVMTMLTANSFATEASVSTVIMLRLSVSAVLSAVLTVGWAVAALVTSAPERSEWSGEPAELGFQDR
ncbi:hypothetical protein KZ829_03970 [Actinoplanes hulinensis]|uniref:Uncharacterized protein n=1 Tax=Actinoplanes hulinensis TaxID=1144547 RepID=A0ABS7AW70_9ACTN|nr:hypothetical protein [Actinoplanes hulinensis]MBW6432897.1 hypothetical protein [Actinoplanes hulinensis]